MKNLRINIFFLILWLTAYGCGNRDKKSSDGRQAEIRTTAATWQRQDKAARPGPFAAGQPEVKAVGKPRQHFTNLNVKIVGAPRVSVAGEPILSTPGADTFLLPERLPALRHSSAAGLPWVITAKDPANKDQNPANFSTYGKPQGLRNSIVCSMLQDKNGNLWFGTYGGGVSRYDGKSFTNFTDKQGLSNVEVWCIVEDKRGNLWFGTNGGGVSCYDGRSFTNFTKKDGLCSNKVFSILEDKSGRLWFGTKEGLSCYDGTSFINFTTKQGLSNNTVYSLLEDKTGCLWIGTYGGGVLRYDGKSFTNYTEKQGLSSNQVYCMLQEQNGRIWFGTSAGACCYNGTSFTTYTEREGLCHNEVWSMRQDKAGSLWFGTNGGGASCYDGKNFTSYTENEGLSNNTVYCILEDKIGNLWFGTYAGGSRYDGKSITNFTDREGLNNTTVFGILEDRSGKLWFGTKGGGVSCYDGRSFTNYTTREGLVDNEVLSMIQDRAGRLWFGTNGGVSCYDGKTFTNFTEKQGLCNNTVLCILEDRRGNLWFGTNGGGLTCYDGNSFTVFTEKEGLSNATILCAIEDRQGALWFGTNAGISCYDGTVFTTFTDKKTLGNTEVWSIVQNGDGSFWVGTNGGGVSYYNGKHFTRFTEKEGLSNTTVWSILQDRAGNFWMGTRSGLCELTKEKYALLTERIKNNTYQEGEALFKDYSNADGFLGIGVNSGKTLLEAKNGTLWIAANDRLMAYHPPRRNQADTVPPKIELTGIELFNEHIPWAALEQRKDSSLKLGNGVMVGNFEFDSLSRWYNLPENLSLVYNNNYLTFNFVGITLSQAAAVKYQYKLEGLDENQSAITNRTSVPYGNLPHGDYTFKVKAVNSDGYWSPEFNYRFTIRPPWWQTWWFRAFAIFSIIAAAWYYIKSREKKLKAEKKKLEHTVALRTAEVMDQKHLIEQKHKEITDSINYAERIQRSFLASKDLLDRNLGAHFVFFQPKDVVSGDFYWAASLKASPENNERDLFYLVTADSTGHGVPGAIMSLLNITSLEKAMEHATEPAEILNHTRRTIIERLKKDGSEEGGKDGMDCSLVAFEFFRQRKEHHQDTVNPIARLTYAAANNAIWVIRKKDATAEPELLELPPDKMPVGKHDKDHLPFTQHQLELYAGDMIYTLTDGMADQFGGPDGKKFMYKKLKAFLISISQLPLAEQKEKLGNVFNAWRGPQEQVDDVCIIGVRI